MDLKLLIKNFRFLEVRNRTASQKTIQYDDITGDGIPDSITINAGAKRRIQTHGLNQVPNMRDFEMISPTIFELQKMGIIQLGEADKGKNKSFGAPEGETLADNAVRTGVAAGMNQRQPSEAANASNAGQNYEGGRPVGAMSPNEKGRRPVEAHPNDKGRR